MTATLQQPGRPRSSYASSYPVPVELATRPSVSKKASNKAKEPFDVKDLSRRLETINRTKTTTRRRHSSIETITVTSTVLPYVPRNAAKAFEQTTEAKVVGRLKPLAPQPLYAKSGLEAAMVVPASTTQDPALGPAVSVKKLWEAGEPNLQDFGIMLDRRQIYNAGITQLSASVSVSDGVARSGIDSAQSKLAALLDETAKQTTRERPKTAYFERPKTAHIENVSATQDDHVPDLPKRRPRTSRYDRTNWAQASQCSDDFFRGPSNLQGPVLKRKDKDKPEDAALNNRTSFHEQYEEPLQQGMIAEAVRLLREQATAPAAHASADNHMPVNYPNVIDVTDLSSSQSQQQSLPATLTGGERKPGKHGQPRGLSLRRLFRHKRHKEGGKVQEEGAKAATATAKSWMDMIEEMGIKNGVMLHDERWETPVVRY